MELLLIGWRNIRRNLRRTVLNGVAIAVGVTVMVVSIGWVRGYFTSFYRGIIRLDTGHIQVLPDGYLEEERRLPLNIAIADYDSLRSALLQYDEVTQVAARISFGAQIGDGVGSTRLLARAIEPEREKSLTVIADHIESGSYYSDGQEGVLLSSSLAGRLGVAPGDSLFVTAIDKTGAENFAETELVGTFNLGYPAIDDTLFYIDMASAERLLGMEGEATRLVIGLDGGPGVANQLREIEAIVGRVVDESESSFAAGSEGLSVYPWRRFVQVIVSAVEADVSGFAIIMAVLFILIVMGILNSMSMAVQERVREIATLRAIGMRKRQLLHLFLAEGVAIALVGALAGLAVGGAVGLYLQQVGFDLSAISSSGLPIPFGDRFTADYRLWDFLASAGLAAVTAVIGSLIPARRAMRLRIADGLGHHLE